MRFSRHNLHLLLACMWSSRCRRVASILIVGISSPLLGAQAPAHSCAYRYHRRIESIGGHDVNVEEYQPVGAGTFPLVFMLHGSAGAFTVKSDNEPQTDNFGEKRLARACFAVVLPHYLEVIGLESITSRRQIETEFPQILSAVGSLLMSAERLPWVRGEPVYLFGESLGGYLSVALALRRNEVAAVSEFSAGLPPGFELVRKSALRLLISHGTDDRLVPVSEARALKQFCAIHSIPVQLDLYPGEGHYFSRQLMSRVIGQTIDFFGVDRKLPNHKPQVTSTTNTRR